MADAPTGMDKQKLKQLLAKSKQEPVNCAIGTGADPALGLLLLDRMKSPRAVEQDLVKETPGAKNTRFGRALVDPDDNPKLVKIIVNKPITGIARKLVKTLKGTGFSKVVILLEDGTELESYAEEDGTDQPAAIHPAETAGGGASPPPAPGAARSDATALTHELAELIRRIAPILAALPARRDVLAGLANDANLQIKAGNLVHARAAIRQLAGALETAAREAVAAKGVAPPPAAPQEGAPDAYAKPRAAWLAARQKLAEQIERLRAEIVAIYREDGLAEALERTYSDQAQRLLAALDTSFADAMAAAGTAPDEAARRQHVAEATSTLQRYRDFAAGEPLIDGLDDNPFVPLTIRRTLDATFAALSAAMH
jgi:hypothetical protein